MVEETDSPSIVVGVVDALAVYLEPLASDARVLVVGPPEHDLDERLAELGARSVHVHDPAGAASDIHARDGAFDLVLIPDLGAFDDLVGTVSSLRRVVNATGAVVAMGRARTDASDASRDDGDAFAELTPAALGYSELYDLFAVRFEHVTMTGVVPFRGVVFAELGHEEADVGVSVDTRLAEPPAPAVFVVVASREPVPLEPYAIVQTGGDDPPRRDLEAEAAFAAMHLKAELLAAQLDDHRARLASAEARAGDVTPRIERLVAERDAALVRAVELEEILAAAQQAMGALERRVLAAEQGMLDRDDRIAALHAELDARRANAHSADEIAALVARAERAEAALALHVADLAQVAEAHVEETSLLEAQLRERAKVIAALEREILRREQLVRELVASLEEAREAGTNGAGHPGPPAPPAPPALPSEPAEEVARLRRKLDELAMEVARREGELRAQAWRITELEEQLARAPATDAATGDATELRRDGARSREAHEDLERELARARDEIEALRQALRQEHALVEQMRAAQAGDARR